MLSKAQIEHQDKVELEMQITGNIGLCYTRKLYLATG